MVAFDMDGVLVDSERFWLERERSEIFPSTVASAVDPEAVTGTNVEGLYDHLDTEFGTTVSKPEFVERYDRAAATVYGEQVSLLDGVDRLLGRLDERDVPVALVSSSLERWIKSPRLHGDHLAPEVSGVTCPDDRPCAQNFSVSSSVTTLSRRWTGVAS